MRYCLDMQYIDALMGSRSVVIIWIPSFLIKYVVLVSNRVSYLVSVFSLSYHVLSHGSFVVPCCEFLKDMHKAVDEYTLVWNYAFADGSTCQYAFNDKQRPASVTVRCSFESYIIAFLYMYVCIFIWIKHTGYNARDHAHQDISLVHCADPGPFPWIKRLVPDRNVCRRNNYYK